MAVRLSVAQSAITALVQRISASRANVRGRYDVHMHEAESDMYATYSVNES